MEIAIVGAVAVLLFGSRLPSVARSLGKSMTEFKKGLNEINEPIRKIGEDDDDDQAGALVAR
ncbi:MAG TPA: twin-arginine translocase TatA/TatE family subunit [Pirellulales bacterium]|nr:twin-arginine translocase TatA/TatE family subunit [Pirellulales bacterium]